MDYATVSLVATREGSKDTARWNLALDPRGGTVLDGEDQMLGRFPWFVLAQCHFNGLQHGNPLTIRLGHLGAWWTCVPDDDGAKTLHKYVPQVCHEFGPGFLRQMKYRSLWTSVLGLILSALTLRALLSPVLGIAHSDPELRIYVIRTVGLIVGLLFVAFGVLSLRISAKIREVLKIAREAADKSAVVGR